MTYPLIFLAVASVVGGFIGITRFITPQFSTTAAQIPIFAPWEPFETAPVAALLGLVAIAVGFVLAYVYYAGADSDPLPRQMKNACNVLRHKFYFDEFYAELVYLFHDTPARAANLGDMALKLLVRLTHGTTEWTGRVLRLVQTGNLQTYALLLAAGAALTLYFMLTR
jgi:NADH:ubiquinone oxidoreductase subunit 5 (subunit L)/multisubunit Na+/H+ antiporter MnhA subunit